MDQHSKLGYREGLVSVILNLLLFVLKYYAGIASASLALIADAWHTLSDSLTSLVVILGIKGASVRTRPLGTNLCIDYRYSVGFGRSRVYERRYRKIEGT